MKKSLSLLLCLTVVLSSVLCVPFMATATTGPVHYYNDFNTTNDLTAKVPGSYTTAALATEDGFSTLKFTNTAKELSLAYGVATVTPTADTDLIVEYRAKHNFGQYNDSVTSWNHTHGNANSTALRKTSVLYDTISDTNVVNNIINDTWNTITVVYKHDQAYREVYVNGVKKGNSASNAGNTKNNPVYADEDLQYALMFNFNSNSGNTIDFDYIKIYEKSSGDFDCEVVNADRVDQKKLTLNFNASVYEISPAQITVNGAAVKSVTKLNGAANTYEIEYANTLEENTGYTLALSNVKDTLGNTLTGTYPITTKPAVNYDVTFEVGENGTVALTDGTPVENGTAISTEMYKTLSFTATPAKGYHVDTVTVNGTPIVGGAFYTTPEITGVSTVAVSFARNTAEPGISAVANAFKVGTETSYAFATIQDTNLDYTLTECGMIYGYQNDDLTYKGADCFTMKNTAALNVKGQFGIGITDPKNVALTGTYLARPYAVYTVSGSDTPFIAYGDIIEVNFQLD